MCHPPPEGQRVRHRSSLSHPNQCRAAAEKPLVLTQKVREPHLLNYVDSPEFQRNIQRALNRGESYHKLVRAVAYANGGKLRVRTDQEQQLWSECSRLLANCIIHYNACILSELLERAEHRQDYERADAIKRANPVGWKYVNLYGAYSFLEIGDGLDLQELVNLLETARDTDPATPD